MLDEDSPQNEKKLFGRRRFPLIVIAAWLQSMVAIFVVVHTRRIYTPLTAWLSKIFYLLGL